MMSNDFNFKSIDFEGLKLNVFKYLNDRETNLQIFLNKLKVEKNNSLSESESNLEVHRSRCCCITRPSCMPRSAPLLSMPAPSRRDPISVQEVLSAAAASFRSLEVTDTGMHIVTFDANDLQDNPQARRIENVQGRVSFDRRVTSLTLGGVSVEFDQLWTMLVQQKIKLTPGITITLKDVFGEDVASFDSTTTVEQLRAMIVASCQTVTIDGIPVGRFQEATSLSAPVEQSMDRGEASEDASSSANSSSSRTDDFFMLLRMVLNELNSHVNGRRRNRSEPETITHATNHIEVCNPSEPGMPCAQLSEVRNVDENEGFLADESAGAAAELTDATHEVPLAERVGPSDSVLVRQNLWGTGQNGSGRGNRLRVSTPADLRRATRLGDPYGNPW